MPLIKRTEQKLKISTAAVERQINHLKWGLSNIRSGMRGSADRGAKRIFRPLRRATKAPRLGWRRLPKKAGENFLLFYSADAFISGPEPF